MLLSNLFWITCFVVSQLAIHVYPLYASVYEIIIDKKKKKIKEDHTHFKTSVESTELVVDDGDQRRDGGSVLHEAPLTVGDGVRLSEKFINNLLHMAFQDFAYD